MFTRRSTGSDEEQHATDFNAPFYEKRLHLLYSVSFFFSCFSLGLLGGYWCVTARLIKVFTSFSGKSATVTGQEEVYKAQTSPLL